MLKLLVPPERAPETIQTLRSLMLPLKASPGFLGCQLYVDAQDPNALCYIEEWQDSLALDAEIRSPHFARIIQVIEAAAAPPIVRLAWVSEVRGLDYLEEVRLRRVDRTEGL